MTQARVNMLAALRELAPAPVAAIMPYLGVTRSAANQVLRDLLAQELVGRDYTRDPVLGWRWRWWLTAAGTAALEERHGRLPQVPR